MNKPGAPIAVLRDRSFGLVCLVAFAAGAVIATAGVFAFHVTFWDVSARYAPMAEAFSSGVWTQAFHPRFGVFFQVLSGLVCRGLNCSGLSACKIAAAYGLSLSAIPLWCLTRRLFDERSAWFSVVIFLLVPTYYDLAVEGLRDSWRIFAFALCALGMLQVCAEKSSRHGSWVFALGLFINTTLRVDGIVISVAFFSAYVAYGLWRRKFSALVLPLMGMVLGLFADSYMVHAYTGVWVPAPHFIGLLEAGG